MELYHAVIDGTLEVLGEEPTKRWTYSSHSCWKDLGANELVLKKEAAYELGGGDKSALHYLCVTTDLQRIRENEVLLYGEDLGELCDDTAYARIVFLSLKEVSKDEDQAYHDIRNLEFIKYHIFPEGYMMRISGTSQREQVRIRKDSLKKGLSFKNVGANFIKEYKKNPHVDHVQIIFVTADSLVSILEPFGEKARATTDALSHILDGLPTDCATCNMKVVCDEVEGMREIHFRREAK